MPEKDMQQTTHFIVKLASTGAINFENNATNTHFLGASIRAWGGACVRIILGPRSNI